MINLQYMVRTILVIISIAFFQYAKSQNITDGLLLEYPFNGSATDISPNSYHGAPNSIMYGTDRFGVANGAAYFNGVDSYINLPNVPQLKPNLPVTFAFWIKYEGYQANDRAVFNTSFENNRNTGVYFTSQAATGRYAVGFGNGDNQYSESSTENYISSATIEVGVWTHVAIVVSSADDMDIYINCTDPGGQYGGTGGGFEYSNTPGSIGRHDQNTTMAAYYFRGYIDDFRYWNRALSVEELALVCDYNFIPCNSAVYANVDGNCVNSDIEYSLVFAGDWDQITDVLWSFSDGSTSTSPTTIKNYSQSDYYTYTLEVTFDNGCVYTASGFTYIENPPEPPMLPDTIIVCQGDSSWLDFSEVEGWTEILDPEGSPVSSYVFTQSGSYEFTFSHPCSQVVEVVEVVRINTEGFLSYSGNNPICENTSVTVDIHSWEEVEGGEDFYLDFGEGDPVFVDTSIFHHVYDSAGYYTIELLGSISECPVYESVNIVVDAPVDFEMQDLYEICQGDSIPVIFDDFEVSLTDSAGDTLNDSYLYDDGVYFLSSENACGTFAYTFEIRVTPFDPQPTDFLTEICPTTDTVWVGAMNDAYFYSWSTGQTTPLIAVHEAGVYSLWVQDNSGLCHAAYNFAIMEVPRIQSAIFDTSGVVLCEEGERLVRPNNLGFPYTFPDGSTGFTYEVTSPGVVGVEFTDGCYVYRESIDVSIVDCICPVEIPNIFTPNGDGLNDVFRPSHACPTPLFELTVFNRWGKEVFYTKSISEGWDGINANNESPMEDGVYYYVGRYGQYLDGVPQFTSFHGHVLLKR